ncbi:hypothetical protein [Demequina sp. NBRC 110056]|uniref:hypothetical protein n=1 Tax=Demequina sp. NBRC 110056 TaxID=1570345 RepID=UPI0009FD9582|nr:hypothetical protein [Demequina sp. NBRC 110056]
MTFETIVAPASAPRTRGDEVRAWRRPLAAGVATAVVVGVGWVLHPVLGIVAAGAVTALSLRLRGTTVSPWTPREHDPVPVVVTSARARALAAGLRWRWEDSCVNAGLGRFVDDRWTYGGLSLVGITEHEGGVVAHARLAPGQTADAVVAAVVPLAAGLEAASTTVIGGHDRTVAILVTPPDEGEGWT